MLIYYFYFSFFFFNDTATTEIYTLSLHDALPIYIQGAWTMCGWLLTYLFIYLYCPSKVVLLIEESLKKLLLQDDFVLLVVC